MLIRYKKSFEKIAMGLLSFMPEGKEVKRLQQTIKEYEINDNWHLYLWKEDDILGAIGIHTEEEGVAIIQHITVNPSHRNQGIGKKMVQAIKKMYKENYVVKPNDLTEHFMLKCESFQNENEL